MSPRLLLVPCLILMLVGCASASRESSVLPAPSSAELLDTDEVLRIREELQRPPEDPVLVMNALERLLPTWQNAQRHGRARPIERELTRKVVVNFPAVSTMFETGPYERQMVAAWALGFARVPPNDVGVESPHKDALALLLGKMRDSRDGLLINVLLGTWRLGDPDTPISPLADLAINHHAPEVRANACLALSSVLTDKTAPDAVEAILVCLGDPDDKVRLHAARVAQLHPEPAVVNQIQTIITEEKTPLVLAAMVRALGAANARESAPLLVFLLESPREVVAASARLALTDMYGEDRGSRREDWEELLPKKA